MAGDEKIDPIGSIFLLLNKLLVFCFPTLLVLCFPYLNWRNLIFIFPFSLINLSDGLLIFSIVF